jgi:hypothetical protein
VLWHRREWKETGNLDARLFVLPLSFTTLVLDVVYVRSARRGLGRNKLISISDHKSQITIKYIFL